MEDKALNMQAQEGARLTGYEFYQRVREIIGRDSGGNKQVRVSGVRQPHKAPNARLTGLSIHGMCRWWTASGGWAPSRTSRARMTLAWPPLATVRPVYVNIVASQDFPAIFLLVCFH
jgi:hypothetical protein